MRKATCIVLGALVTSVAWGRLGETEKQAEERYGTPLKAVTNEQFAAVLRVYKKGGVLVSAAFYKGPSGKMEIGQIEYAFTPEVTNRGEMTETLLAANADGGTWKLEETTARLGEPAIRKSRRPGAAAEVKSDAFNNIASVEVTLDAFAAHISALEAKIEEQEKKDQTGF